MISKNYQRMVSAQVLRLLRDESGAELVEAVLVIGLIALICIASMKGVSVSITQKWNDVLGMFSGDQNA